jgi:hypothetical protein
MRHLICAALCAGGLVSQAMAQDVDPYVQAAIDSGICGDAPVASAVFDPATNQVSVTCEEDVAGFLPLVGGLGPILAGGAALVLAAAGGGGGASDTQ